MAIISVTGMPGLGVLMPVFGDYFGGPQHGARVFGLLGTASGVGALVGSVMLANRKTVVGLGTQIALASGVFGAAIIVFAMSREMWLSMLIVAIAGWGMITNFAGANTILQTLADDDKRGRVMSFFTMAFIGMTPFGNLGAGFLASHLGPANEPVIGASRSLMLLGIVVLLACAVYCYMLPMVRRIVRPIYISKGIMPEVAEGLQAAADMADPRDQ
jgi:hypothetical protein